MRSRGIFNPEKLLRLATADAIAGAIRWYDEQSERTATVSPGVLANAILDGGMPGYGETTAAPACPCTPELEAEWAAALKVLDEAEADFELVWAQKCHPHRHDVAGWQVGAPAWVLGWLPKYLPAIRRMVGEQITTVACDPAPTNGGKP